MCASLALTKPCAASDLQGVYVEPKVFATSQHSTKTKTNGSIFSVTPPEISDRYESGVGAGLAIGYDFYAKFNVPIRTELEYTTRNTVKSEGTTTQDFGGYSVSQTTSRKTQASTLFANMYYDFKNGTSFTPYVGGGIGAAFVRTRDSWSSDAVADELDSSKNSTNFAWNIGAGVAYSFDQHWALDLGYRYVDFGKLKGSDMEISGYGSTQIQSEFSGHEIGLGLRYSF